MSIRATAEVFPSWMTLEPHLGWDGLAGKLVSRAPDITRLMDKLRNRGFIERAEQLLGQGAVQAFE